MLQTAGRPIRTIGICACVSSHCGLIDAPDVSQSNFSGISWFQSAVVPYALCLAIVKCLGDLPVAILAVVAASAVVLLVHVLGVLGVVAVGSSR